RARQSDAGRRLQSRYRCDCEDERLAQAQCELDEMSAARQGTIARLASAPRTLGREDAFTILQLATGTDRESGAYSRGRKASEGFGHASFHDRTCRVPARVFLCPGAGGPTPASRRRAAGAAAYQRTGSATERPAGAGNDAGTGPASSFDQHR